MPTSIKSINFLFTKKYMKAKIIQLLDGSVANHFVPGEVGHSITVSFDVVVCVHIYDAICMRHMIHHTSCK